LYNLIDKESVKFTSSINQEDKQKIDSLNMLKESHPNQMDIATILKYYNELARFFLLERKWKCA